MPTADDQSSQSSQGSAIKSPAFLPRSYAASRLTVDLECSQQQPVTVDSLIERIGLSEHHWAVITVVWISWIVAGWMGTLVPIILDAAGDTHGDWAMHRTDFEPLTTRHKSVTLFIAGIAGMFGNLLIGNLSDVRGRVFASACATGICAILVWSIALCRNRLMLMCLLMLSPFSRDGFPGVTQCLLAEWLPNAPRAFFLVSLHAVWSLGRLMMTILWSLCPPSESWVLFCALSALPPLYTSLMLAMHRRSYESPRWLAVTGNIHNCIMNLQLAAQYVPRVCLPAGWDTGELQHESTSSQESQQHSVWVLLTQHSSPELKRLIFLLCIYNLGLFFGSNGYFLWSMEYFRRSGIDPKPLMVAAPLGKICCNLFLILPGPGNSLIDRCPSVPLMRIGFLGCAVALLLHCYPMSGHILSCVVFMGQFFEEMIWTVGSIYMTEAFPTAVRSTAVGLLFTVGHLGNMLSSSLTGELLEVSIFLPMLAMSFSLFLGFVVCFFIPPGHDFHSLQDSL